MEREGAIVHLTSGDFNQQPGISDYLVKSENLQASDIVEVQTVLTGFQGNTGVLEDESFLKSSSISEVSGEEICRKHETCLAGEVMLHAEKEIPENRKHVLEDKRLEAAEETGLKENEVEAEKEKRNSVDITGSSLQMERTEEPLVKDAEEGTSGERISESVEAIETRQGSVEEINTTVDEETKTSQDSKEEASKIDESADPETRKEVSTLEASANHPKEGLISTPDPTFNNMDRAAETIMEACQEPENKGNASENTIIEEKTREYFKGVKDKVPESHSSFFDEVKDPDEIKQTEETENEKESKTQDTIGKATSTAASTLDIRDNEETRSKIRGGVEDKLDMPSVTSAKDSSSINEDEFIEGTKLERTSSIACKEESPETISTSEDVKGITPALEELQEKNIVDTPVTQTEKMSLENVNSSEIAGVLSKTVSEYIVKKSPQEGQTDILDKTSEADDGEVQKVEDKINPEEKLDGLLVKYEEAKERAGEELAMAEASAGESMNKGKHTVIMAEDKTNDEVTIVSAEHNKVETSKHEENTVINKSEKEIDTTVPTECDETITFAKGETTESQEESFKEEEKSTNADAAKEAGMLKEEIPLPKDLNNKIESAEPETQNKDNDDMHISPLLEKKTVAESQEQLQEVTEASKGEEKNIEIDSKAWESTKTSTSEPPSTEGKNTTEGILETGAIVCENVENVPELEAEGESEIEAAGRAMAEETQRKAEACETHIHEVVTRSHDTLKCEAVEVTSEEACGVVLADKKIEEKIHKSIFEEAAATLKSEDDDKDKMSDTESEEVHKEPTTTDVAEINVERNTENNVTHSLSEMIKEEVVQRSKDTEKVAEMSKEEEISEQSTEENYSKGTPRESVEEGSIKNIQHYKNDTEKLSREMHEDLETAKTVDGIAYETIQNDESPDSALHPSLVKEQNIVQCETLPTSEVEEKVESTTEKDEKEKNDVGLAEVSKNTEKEMSKDEGDSRQILQKNEPEETDEQTKKATPAEVEVDSLSKMDDKQLTAQSPQDIEKEEEMEKEEDTEKQIIAQSNTESQSQESIEQDSMQNIQNDANNAEELSSEIIKDAEQAKTVERFAHKANEDDESATSPTQLVEEAENLQDEGRDITPAEALPEEKPEEDTSLVKAGKDDPSICELAEASGNGDKEASEIVDDVFHEKIQTNEEPSSNRQPSLTKEQENPEIVNGKPAETSAEVEEKVESPIEKGEKEKKDVGLAEVSKNTEKEMSKDEGDLGQILQNNDPEETDEQTKKATPVEVEVDSLSKKGDKQLIAQCPQDIEKEEEMEKEEDTEEQTVVQNNTESQSQESIEQDSMQNIQNDENNAEELSSKIIEDAKLDKTVERFTHNANEDDESATSPTQLVEEAENLQDEGKDITPAEALPEEKPEEDSSLVKAGKDDESVCELAEASGNGDKEASEIVYDVFDEKIQTNQEPSSNQQPSLAKEQENPKIANGNPAETSAEVEEEVKSTLQKDEKEKKDVGLAEVSKNTEKEMSKDEGDSGQILQKNEPEETDEQTKKATPAEVEADFLSKRGDKQLTAQSPQDTEKEEDMEKEEDTEEQIIIQSNTESQSQESIEQDSMQNIQNDENNAEELSSKIIEDAEPAKTVGRFAHKANEDDVSATSPIQLVEEAENLQDEGKDITPAEALPEEKPEEDSSLVKAGKDDENICELAEAIGNGDKEASETVDDVFHEKIQTNEEPSSNQQPSLAKEQENPEIANGNPAETSAEVEEKVESTIEKDEKEKNDVGLVEISKNTEKEMSKDEGDSGQILQKNEPEETDGQTKKATPAEVEADSLSKRDYKQLTAQSPQDTEKEEEIEKEEDTEEQIIVQSNTESQSQESIKQDSMQNIQDDENNAEELSGEIIGDAEPAKTVERFTHKANEDDESATSPTQPVEEAENLKDEGKDINPEEKPEESSLVKAAKNNESICELAEASGNGDNETSETVDSDFDEKIQTNEEPSSNQQLSLVKEQENPEIVNGNPAETSAEVEEKVESTIEKDEKEKNDVGLAEVSKNTEKEMSKDEGDSGQILQKNEPEEIDEQTKKATPAEVEADSLSKMDDKQLTAQSPQDTENEEEMEKKEDTEEQIMVQSNAEGQSQESIEQDSMQNFQNDENNAEELSSEMIEAAEPAKTVERFTHKANEDDESATSPTQLVEEAENLQDEGKDITPTEALPEEKTEEDSSLVKAGKDDENVCELAEAIENADKEASETVDDVFHEKIQTNEEPSSNQQPSLAKEQENPEIANGNPAETSTEVEEKVESTIEKDEKEKNDVGLVEISKNTEKEMSKDEGDSGQILQNKEPEETDEQTKKVTPAEVEADSLNKKGDKQLTAQSPQVTENEEEMEKEEDTEEQIIVQNNTESQSQESIEQDSMQHIQNDENNAEELSSKIIEDVEPAKTVESFAHNTNKDDESATSPTQLVEEAKNLQDDGKDITPAEALPEEKPEEDSSLVKAGKDDENICELAEAIGNGDKEASETVDDVFHEQIQTNEEPSSNQQPSLAKEQENPEIANGNPAETSAEVEEKVESTIEKDEKEKNDVGLVEISKNTEKEMSKDEGDSGQLLQNNEPEETDEQTKKVTPAEVEADSLNKKGDKQLTAQSPQDNEKEEEMEKEEDTEEQIIVQNNIESQSQEFIEQDSMQNIQDDENNAEELRSEIVGDAEPAKTVERFTHKANENDESATSPTQLVEEAENLQDEGKDINPEEKPEEDSSLVKAAKNDESICKLAEASGNGDNEASETVDNVFDEKIQTNEEPSSNQQPSLVKEQENPEIASGNPVETSAEVEEKVESTIEKDEKEKNDVGLAEVSKNTEKEMSKDEGDSGQKLQKNEPEEIDELTKKATPAEVEADSFSKMDDKQLTAQSPQDTENEEEMEKKEDTEDQIIVQSNAESLSQESIEQDSMQNIQNDENNAEELSSEIIEDAEPAKTIERFTQKVNEDDESATSPTQLVEEAENLQDEGKDITPAEALPEEKHKEDSSLVKAGKDDENVCELAEAIENADKEASETVDDVFHEKIQTNEEPSSNQQPSLAKEQENPEIANGNPAETSAEVEEKVESTIEKDETEKNDVGLVEISKNTEKEMSKDEGDSGQILQNKEPEETDEQTKKVTPAEVEADSLSKMDDKQPTAQSPQDTENEEEMEKKEDMEEQIIVQSNAGSQSQESIEQDSMQNIQNDENNAEELSSEIIEDAEPAKTVERFTHKASEDDESATSPTQLVEEAENLQDEGKDITPAEALPEEKHEEDSSFVKAGKDDESVFELAEAIGNDDKEASETVDDVLNLKVQTNEEPSSNQQPSLAKEQENPEIINGNPAETSAEVIETRETVEVKSEEDVEQILKNEPGENLENTTAAISTEADAYALYLVADAPDNDMIESAENVAKTAEVPKEEQTEGCIIQESNAKSLEKTTEQSQKKNFQEDEKNADILEKLKHEEEVENVLQNEQEENLEKTAEVDASYEMINIPDKMANESLQDKEEVAEITKEDQSEGFIIQVSNAKSLTEETTEQSREKHFQEYEKNAQNNNREIFEESETNTVHHRDEHETNKNDESSVATLITSQVKEEENLWVGPAASQEEKKEEDESSVKAAEDGDNKAGLAAANENTKEETTEIEEDSECDLQKNEPEEIREESSNVVIPKNEASTLSEKPDYITSLQEVEAIKTVEETVEDKNKEEKGEDADETKVIKVQTGEDLEPGAEQSVTHKNLEMEDVEEKSITGEMEVEMSEKTEKIEKLEGLDSTQKTELKDTTDYIEEETKQEDIKQFYGNTEKHIIAEDTSTDNLSQCTGKETFKEDEAEEIPKEVKDSDSEIREETEATNSLEANESDTLKEEEKSNDGLQFENASEGTFLQESSENLVEVSTLESGTEELIEKEETTIDDPLCITGERKETSLKEDKPEDKLQMESSDLASAEKELVMDSRETTLEDADASDLVDDSNSEVREETTATSSLEANESETLKEKEESNDGIHTENASEERMFLKDCSKSLVKVSTLDCEIKEVIEKEETTVDDEKEETTVDDPVCTKGEREETSLEEDEPQDKGQMENSDHASAEKELAMGTRETILKNVVIDNQLQKASDLVDNDREIPAPNDEAEVKIEQEVQKEVPTAGSENPIESSNFEDEPQKCTGSISADRNEVTQEEADSAKKFKAMLKEDLTGEEEPIIGVEAGTQNQKLEASHTKTDGALTEQSLEKGEYAKNNEFASETVTRNLCKETIPGNSSMEVEDNSIDSQNESSESVKQSQESKEGKQESQEKTEQGSEPEDLIKEKQSKNENVEDIDTKPEDACDLVDYKDHQIRTEACKAEEEIEHVVQSQKCIDSIGEDVKEATLEEEDSGMKSDANLQEGIAVQKELAVQLEAGSSTENGETLREENIEKDEQGKEHQFAPQTVIKDLSKETAPETNLREVEDNRTDIQSQSSELVKQHQVSPEVQQQTEEKTEPLSVAEDHSKEISNENEIVKAVMLYKEKHEEVQKADANESVEPAKEEEVDIEKLHTVSIKDIKVNEVGESSHASAKCLKETDSNEHTEVARSEVQEAKIKEKETSVPGVIEEEKVEDQAVEKADANGTVEPAKEEDNDIKEIHNVSIKDEKETSVPKVIRQEKVEDEEVEKAGANETVEPAKEEEVDIKELHNVSIKEEKINEVEESSYVSSEYLKATDSKEHTEVASSVVQAAQTMVKEPSVSEVIQEEKLEDEKADANETAKPAKEKEVDKKELHTISTEEEKVNEVEESSYVSSEYLKATDSDEDTGVASSEIQEAQTLEKEMSVLDIIEAEKVEDEGSKKLADISTITSAEESEEKIKEEVISDEADTCHDDIKTTVEEETVETSLEEAQVEEKPGQVCNITSDEISPHQIEAVLNQLDQIIESVPPKVVSSKSESQVQDDEHENVMEESKKHFDVYEYNDRGVQKLQMGGIRGEIKEASETVSKSEGIEVITGNQNLPEEASEEHQTPSSELPSKDEDYVSKSAVNSGVGIIKDEDAEDSSTSETTAQTCLQKEETREIKVSELGLKLKSDMPVSLNKEEEEKAGSVEEIKQVLKEETKEASKAIAKSGSQSLEAATKDELARDIQRFKEEKSEEQYEASSCDVQSKDQRDASPTDIMKILYNIKELEVLEQTTKETSSQKEEPRELEVPQLEFELKEDAEETPNEAHKEAGGASKEIEEKNPASQSVSTSIPDGTEVVKDDEIIAVETLTVQKTEGQNQTSPFPVERIEEKTREMKMLEDIPKPVCKEQDGDADGTKEEIKEASESKSDSQDLEAAETKDLPETTEETSSHKEEMREIEVLQPESLISKDIQELNVKEVYEGQHKASDETKEEIKEISDSVFKSDSQGSAEEEEDEVGQTILTEKSEEKDQKSSAAELPQSQDYVMTATIVDIAEHVKEAEVPVKNPLSCSASKTTEEKYMEKEEAKELEVSRLETENRDTQKQSPKEVHNEEGTIAGEALELQTQQAENNIDDAECPAQRERITEFAGPSETTSNLIIQTSEEAFQTVSEAHDQDVKSEPTKFKETHLEAEIGDLIEGEIARKKAMDATEIIHQEITHEMVKEEREDARKCHQMALGEEITQESHQKHELRAEEGLRENKTVRDIQNEEVYKEIEKSDESKTAKENISTVEHLGQEAETSTETLLDEAGGTNMKDAAARFKADETMLGGVNFETTNVIKEDSRVDESHVKGSTGLAEAKVIAGEIYQQGKTSDETYEKNTLTEAEPCATKETMIVPKELHDLGYATAINSEVEEVKNGADKTVNDQKEKSAKVSLLDTIERSTRERELAGDLNEEKELHASKEELKVETETVKSDEEKEAAAAEEEEEEEEDHQKTDSISDAPVMVEAYKDMAVKHKKSHNILAGVGSKVKHSISKVKKAITGKSSHAKQHSPKGKSKDA